MKTTMSWIMIGSLLLGAAAGSAVAQDDTDEPPRIVPVEIYVCNFNDGKGPADLDGWVERWNAWADANSEAPYSGYTLNPFYYGENQDFDFLWLGVSPNMTSMGQAYEDYFATSGGLAGEFVAIADCGAHSNFATMNIKPPPDDDAKNFILTFADCNTKEGKSWDDTHAALKAWADYRNEHGSEAGMWVMWPAYGGGAVEFEFKLIASYRSLDKLGADWDQYASGGYAKAGELFGEVMKCDVARVYTATERRDGIPDED